MDLSPYLPMMTWSNKGICNSSPAEIRLRVTARSSLLGSASPEGWLCATIMDVAKCCRAAENTSLGWAKDESTVPIVMHRHPKGWFLVFRKTAQNSSTGLSSRNLKYCMAA